MFAGASAGISSTGASTGAGAGLETIGAGAGGGVEWQPLQKREASATEITAKKDVRRAIAFLYFG